MNKKYSRFLSLLMMALFALSPLLSSCSSEKDEPDVPEEIDGPVVPESPVSRTVLVYSVAANNLLRPLRSDSVEMVKAAESIAGLEKDVRFLLYFASGTNCTLSELRIRNQIPAFRVLKEYPLATLSTDPARLSEVIADVKELRPADNYGLIFESHGTGWVPDFFDHQTGARSEAQDEFPAVPFSFGDDRTGGSRDSIDIDELADAIPDRMFDFIWFDACYMAGIETVYQFRRKCDTFVGYVTEIGSEGMPYEIILPYLVRPLPGLEEGAQQLFDSYNKYGQPVSVSVISTAGLEELARASKPLLSPDPYTSYTGMLQKYSRFTTGPFYDFRQYAEISGSNLNATEAELDRFHQALENCVVFKRLSPIDFNGNRFDDNLFGGLNCHVPGQTYKAEREEYYYSLDWSRDVYGEVSGK